MERIGRKEDPPTALLVTSDQVAAGMLAYCKEHGIHVPDELALIGFDNQPIAKMLNITTFEISLEEIGQRPFRQAIAETRSHQEIPLLFIERSSV